MERIEGLLPLIVPLTDKNLIELDLLSPLVAEEHEDEYYPNKAPSLVNVNQP